jgi:hypothetical protein
MKRGVFWSWLCGWAVVFAIFGLVNLNGISEQTAELLLSPAAAITDAMGFGGHDPVGFLAWVAITATIFALPVHLIRLSLSKG